MEQWNSFALVVRTENHNTDHEMGNRRKPEHIIMCSSKVRLHLRYSTQFG